MSIFLNHFVLEFQLGTQLCTHHIYFGQIYRARFPAQACSFSLFMVKYKHVNCLFAASENVSHCAILKGYFV